VRSHQTGQAGSDLGIELVLFDFGGVLYTPIEAEKVRARRDKLAHDMGFENGYEMWQHFYGGPEWQLTKTGRMSEQKMWSTLLTRLGLDSKGGREAFLRKMFSGVGVEPDMRLLLDQLSKSFRLGILSNASDRLERLVVEKLELGHYFEAIINSHRIGVAKPDQTAYQIALEKFNVSAAEVLFVDDQERNTAVAESIGIRSHVFTSVASLRRYLIQLGMLSG
jgi:putative hydrolase of the HAD superfamily